MKRWQVSLIMLCCCCASQGPQRLAAQSATRALTQLAPTWSPDGPPTQGLSSTIEDLQDQLLQADAARLLQWRVKPHDPAQDPDTRRLVASAQAHKVQLDKAPLQELIFLLQLYSGELFVLLFTQTEASAWAFVDVYRLPALARRESCRALGDGVARFESTQSTQNAPAFLWLEVQASDQCAARRRTERTLHLLALQGGALRPTLELPLLQERENSQGQRVGAQLTSEVKLEPARNTLLISGVRRMFSEAGEAEQEARLFQWYYFDGARYQKQN